MKPACLVLTIALLSAAPSLAQDTDCKNALAQSELNACAYADWEAADADLNAAYQQAVVLLEGWDARLPVDERGGVKALRDAQRAWISFRDNACAAEGYAMKGGSAEPLVVYGCMRVLTLERAAHLWRMIEAYEG
jgi:uncharacterized protein YecT (DUF1311 family)